MFFPSLANKKIEVDEQPPRADLDIKIDVWRKFSIRYSNNYYTLHRSDLAARAAPLDPRLASLKGY